RLPLPAPARPWPATDWTCPASATSAATLGRPASMPAAAASASSSSAKSGPATWPTSPPRKPKEAAAMLKRTLYHFHFCCGLGGGAKGFNRAKPVVGNVQANWECLGGIDVDPAGLTDFSRLAGVPGTLLDLFTRDQYVRFHGKEPPLGWREATAEDVRRAAQGKRPDAVFISSPCKGASGLLSEKMSQTPKYQALNELTLRCIWLM